MMADRLSVLVVDDERDVREPMALYLQSEGFAATTASNGVEALRVLSEDPVDVVLSDIRMPEMDGMELLQKIQEQHPGIPVIIFTAFGNEDTAAAAIKAGAREYILKPVVFEDMQQKILRVCDEGTGAPVAPSARTTPDRVPGTVAGDAADEPPSLSAIRGQSRQVDALKTFVQRVARAGSPTLIHGESGTGKELVARALHELSDRSREPFVAINCAAVPEALLESEFFGHARGSFTGAHADKKGLFEVAGAGTLFLDEIAELPVHMQAKLLRALEEREVTPIGKSAPVAVRATVVAASARRLKDEVDAGRFRMDLFFRINVIEIDVPPLRDREGDAAFLARAFLHETRGRLLTTAENFSNPALAAVANYEWPGNIRELRNVVERAAVVARGARVELADLPDDIASSVGDRPRERGLKQALRSFERDYILRTLRECDGDKRVASEALGIGLSSLYRKLDELGIE